MKNENKKTLDEMIAKMLVNDELNAEQMQIVDLLCVINESKTIASNVYYEANNGTVVDDFKDFIVENEEQIWEKFNSCRMMDFDELELESISKAMPALLCNHNIDKLVLLNSKNLDGTQEETRIIVDFVYANGVPAYCYVRIVYHKVDKDGTRNLIYNWNEESDVCDFSLDEIKEIKDYHKKSDFFFKIKFELIDKPAV